MLDIGMLELSLVAVVALLVLGPERLPAAMRSFGRAMGRIKGMMANFQEQMEVQARNLDMKERLEKNRQALADYERRLAGQLLADQEDACAKRTAANEAVHGGRASQATRPASTA